MSVQLLADTVNIPKTVVHRSYELNMQKVCAKLVPKLLTDEQKANRVLIASELKERVEINPDFLAISGRLFFVPEDQDHTQRTPF
jgi:hypothetical protein